MGRGRVKAERMRFWREGIGSVLLAGFAGCAMLAVLSGMLLPVTALGASTPPAVSGDVRRAGEDLARVLGAQPPLEEFFALLRQGGLSYDAELTVPTRYVRECRRGRALSTLLGLYRTDHAYARAFGQSSSVPLQDTLEQTELPGHAARALLRCWNAESGKEGSAPSSAQLRQQLLRQLASVEEVREMVDIFYGNLLEQVHILCVSLLRVPQEQWKNPSLASAVQDAVRRLDAFRRVLQGWATTPALLKEMGLHSDITLLDRVQADLELWLMQPSSALAQAALDKVDETRSDLARLCKLPPKEDPGPYWRLQEREDLFKPRNFF